MHKQIYDGSGVHKVKLGYYSCCFSYVSRTFKFILPHPKLASFDSIALQQPLQNLQKLTFLKLFKIFSFLV